MDYWSLCLSKEGMSVCLTGVLIGIVLTLIMVWIWFAWGAGENFMGSDMSPEAKKLLVMHWAADPGSGRMDKEIYGKQ